MEKKLQSLESKGKQKQGLKKRENKVRKETQPDTSPKVLLVSLQSTHVVHTSLQSVAPFCDMQQNALASIGPSIHRLLVFFDVQYFYRLLDTCTVSPLHLG